MFEGLDLNNMGKMMEQMQAKAQELQEKSKETILTAKGGGGMVQVSANGLGEIIDITLDDSLLEDKESLQILLISTRNDVLKMVEATQQAQAMGMFGGLNPFGGGA
jgi:DNA-binding YbaB/EbfC family protein